MSLFFNRFVSIPRSGSAALRDTSLIACRGALARAQFVQCKGLLIRTILFNFPVTDLMTLIQRTREEGTMDSSTCKDDNRKSSRPVRNRRYTRRSLVAGQRPQKRLFTPEIKRYLKDWLVRRRENPYPNREEKKYLSRETGLTYIQICNWFANWRRKLKNANDDRNQQTWGHLIRTYNDRAQGNVEQFSISSGDSIWSEPEPNSSEHEDFEIDAEYPKTQEEDYQQEESDSSSTMKDAFENNNSYTLNINSARHIEESKSVSSPLLLSKWLESAARFQPSESNYSWWVEDKKRRPENKVQRITINTLSRHAHEEVEAAVALTALATATSRPVTTTFSG